MRISKRQIRRTRATKESIKRIFIDLILENKDVDPITVSEITALADLNRGTFYIHYQDKYELLEALFDDAVNGLYQAMKIPYKETDELPMTEAAPFTEMVFEHVEKNQALYKSLDLLEMSPNLYDRLERMLFNLFTEEIVLVLEKPADIEYEIFLNFQLHATLGVIKYWIKNDFSHPAAFMSEQLTMFPLQKVVAMNLRKNE